MYFGGPISYNSFLPSEIVEDTFMPQIILSDFKVLNKSVKIGEEIDGKVILSKAIDETSEIVLDYEAKLFSFDFYSTNYESSESVEYAYMLVGFDTDWNYIENKKFVSFTNIPPGEYTLKIKGTNSDGIWERRRKIFKNCYSSAILGKKLVSGFNHFCYYWNNPAIVSNKNYDY